MEASIGTALQNDWERTWLIVNTGAEAQGFGSRGGDERNHLCHHRSDYTSAWVGGSFAGDPGEDIGQGGQVLNG